VAAGSLSLSLSHKFPVANPAAGVKKLRLHLSVQFAIEFQELKSDPSSKFSSKREREEGIDKEDKTTATESPLP
jgi:hypothetical protein